MTTYLTPNFTLEELCKSVVATNRGWDNMAKGEFADNLKALCENILQPLRNHFMQPITIMSGYRSANVNRAVGGAFNSQHLIGQAADIEIAGVPNADLWRYIYATLPFDQVIAEHFKKDDGAAGWVHVSYNKVKNRGEALSCVAPNDYVQGLQYATS